MGTSDSLDGEGTSGPHQSAMSSWGQSPSSCLAGLAAARQVLPSEDKRVPVTRMVALAPTQCLKTLKLGAALSLQIDPRTRQNSYENPARVSADLHGRAPSSTGKGHSARTGGRGGSHLRCDGGDAAAGAGTTGSPWRTAHTITSGQRTQKHTHKHDPNDREQLRGGAAASATDEAGVTGQKWDFHPNLTPAGKVMQNGSELQSRT